jgi:tetratricopeptide (TPR) repeat protein
MMRGGSFRAFFQAARGSLLLALAACSWGDSSYDVSSGKIPQPLRSPIYEDNQTLTSAALKLKLTHQFLLYQSLKMRGDESAAPILAQSAADDPASAHLQLLMSREASRLGDFESAEQAIRRAFDLNPTDREIRTEYVNVLSSRDKFSEAYVHLEKLLDEAPADEELLTLAINIDMRRDDYWVSLKRLERALKVSVSPEFIHYKMGRVYRDMGKNAEARVEFEKSLALDPNYYQAATYLAILTEELGDEKRALELYEGLAHLTNNVLYHRKLASLFMKRKDYPKAIEAFQNLLQLEPSDMSGLLQMARAWIEVGDLGKSEEKFRELLSLDPKNGTLRLMLGMLLEAQSRTQEALDEYVQIQGDSTAYYDSMNLRLKALHKLNRKVQLLEDLDQSLKLAEKTEDAVKAQVLLRTVAQYYVELEDLPRSENVLSAALKRFPSSEALLFQKGMLLEKMRRFDDGVKVMLSILSTNPQHVGALNYVGYTWADQGKNLDEAETFIKKALAIEPEDPFITDSLGWVYYQQGHYELAYETMMKAYRKVPREFVIVEHLGDILVKLGRLSEARDYYAKALQLKPDHQDMLAKVQSKLQKVDEKLPPDARMGRNDHFCDGLVNRRCDPRRLQQSPEDSERAPASKTGSGSARLQGT